MIQIKWWSRSNDDFQWWSRSSDDPDLVMMSSDDPNQVMIQIQRLCLMMFHIEWWSRSSDDVPWWSRSRDDPDSKNEYDLKMKMTWRRRWLDDDPDDTKKKTCTDKLCQENTFLVKRECWCICNFRMYSSMYLIYCNLMFISGCFYYVFQSCFHAPTFQLGGLIM